MAHRKPPEDGLERRLREAKDRRTDPLRQQAQRLLEQFHNRQPEPPPAKPLKLKKPKRYRTKGTSKAEALARTEINRLVTPEAQAKGDYQFGTIKLQEVTEAGHRINKEVPGVRNIGSTPVERWHARGRLTEREMAAVLFYQSAWGTWIGEPRVIANYSPSVSRNVNGAVELWASSRIRAKESLRLLDQEVFFRIPVEHFHVWQNVVIWDEPAGVAGGRAGFVSTKQSEAAARLIVCLVAKMIADVVIDSSRNDFGDLLLNLDAARQPGRRR